MDLSRPNHQQLGSCRIYASTNEVEINKKRIKLTPKEMGVLALLHSNLDNMVTRKELLEEVWGAAYANDQGLTQAISRLRQIFNDCPSIQIRTIPKSGYLLTYTAPKQVGFRRKKIKISIPVLAVAVAMVILVLIILILPVGINIKVEKMDAKEGASTELKDR